MNIVAEAGVAAHWLYKAQQGHDSEHLSTQWLQSLLDIQNETRDAAEFWDHVKVDLFPDAVYVFTPKSEIMAMPRGATVVDFAYAIHSKIGNRTTAAKINDEEVPLRTELKSGDVVQIITSESSTPNPAWLSFVKTGRARSKIRSFLKNAAQSEAGQLGETLLAQALRAEGIDAIPPQDDANKPVWEEILRTTGNRAPADLMVDIGMGRRIASLVAARMTTFMARQGVRPDALLITQERFNTDNRPFQGAVTLNGDESSSVHYSHCCRPVPGDPILGYLGGQGLVVHHAQCHNAIKLREKDADRFITVDWADDITRVFEAGIVVTVQNNKGVLARVAAELANAEADIVRVEMTDEVAVGTTDLRFVISVHNNVQLENALRNLRRLHSVVRAGRVIA